MAKATDPVNVFLEMGKKRTFAAAVDWPGWARSGRDEDSALRTLFEYGPRYERVLRKTKLDFHAPTDLSALAVVDRLEGNATTDFGALSLDLPADTEPVEPSELERWQAILKACWKAFDSAADAATGHSLRKGPRGGGRDLSKIVQHVLDVDSSYLSNLGGKFKAGDATEPAEALPPLREAILTTLAQAVRGELPTHGPRGGARWTPRYFVRRLAWHELDHAWEIEDRKE